MEKFLYPNNPVKCIKTVPFECGGSVFLTNLTLKNINEYDQNSSFIHPLSIKISIEN